MPVEGIEALNFQDEVQIFVNGEGFQHTEVFIEEWIHSIDATYARRVSKRVSARPSKMGIVLIVESGLALIC